MKIVKWSDCHLEHSIAQDNLRGSRKSVLVLDVLENIIFSMDKKPDVILVNGDFFDAFGKIASDLAVEVVERMEQLAATGIKIIFITGNHEWPDVEPEYFGRGILTALFAGKESIGIYVVDQFARYIRLDDSHVVLGLPYRETYEQFEVACLEPMRSGIEKGLFVPGKDKLIVGWHVGLPFATAWRGEEDENAWITADHPAVREIFAHAYDKRIYLGHYHGPGDSEFITKDGEYIGTGTYIGSPATRSRAESGQDKRVGVWDDGNVSFISTGLNLDAVVNSVEAAVEHLSQLVDKFGEEILDTASVFVDLGPDASMDDYHVALTKAAHTAGDINIDRPIISKKGMVDHIVTKHQQDPGSTREKLEIDIFHYSIRLYFKNADFKGLSDGTIDAMVGLGYKTWKRLGRSVKKAEIDQEALSAVEAAFLSSGVTRESMPAFTAEFCSQAATLSKTEELAKQIALTV